MRRWLFDRLRRSAHAAPARRRRGRRRCRRRRGPLRRQGPQLCGVAAVAVAPPLAPPRPHQTGKLHQRPLRQLHDAPCSLRQISIKLAYHDVATLPHPPPTPPSEINPGKSSLLLLVWNFYRYSPALRFHFCLVVDLIHFFQNYQFKSLLIIV